MNVRDLYIEFFKERGHKELGSAPVVPENDPTSLFNTAGMQPLVPYLSGQPHPEGKKLVNCQKCMRTVDLDSIGDKTHHTFFEMLGNWSLGDYFKKESITWSFEFLTKTLNLPAEKLAATVFKGNDKVAPDSTSAEIWMSLGIPKERISFLGEEDNWWGLEFGPCGPCSEIFFWRSDDPTPAYHDPEDERWVEIWNNVFMEFNKKETGELELLEKPNVDTGMGFERIVSIVENVQDNYQTTIFKDVIEKIEEISSLSYEGNEKAMRIIADHIRAAVMISGEDTAVKPSNTDQGYILRRLIRRTIRYAKQLNIDINGDFDTIIADMFIEKYKKYYSCLERNREQILSVLTTEKTKFARTIEKGLKEFEKMFSNMLRMKLHERNPKLEAEIYEELQAGFDFYDKYPNEAKDLMKSMKIDAIEAFKLYDTFGFPIELTEELAHEKGIEVDIEGFRKKFIEHQEKSRAGATEKFKGGLSSSSDMDIKYHTATHLLNAALKVVLGNHVHQMGSNITPERMRFDFSHDTKVTPEELKQVEDLVNDYIKQGLDVIKMDMPKEEAIKIGAEAMFIEKYGDIVTVYSIDELSKELCGGPHVKNTNELGTFKIKKEEASSSGVRRIKAILE